MVEFTGSQSASAISIVIKFIIGGDFGCNVAAQPVQFDFENGSGYIHSLTTNSAIKIKMHISGHTK